VNGAGFTVYPAVDISGGRCVRLLQGRFGTETVYSDNPVEVALGFNAAGARWLHVVDLDGARSGVPVNRALVLETARLAKCPVQAGGGMRTLGDVEEALAAGANRVILGTIALEEPAAVSEACERYGERVAVSLDARGGELSSHGWTVGTGVPLLDAVKRFEDAGVSMFVYTDTTRDGTMSGPDIEGLLRLTDATERPVVASGGISSLDELRAVARLRANGVTGAIVGRALYEQKFGVGEANRVADEAAAGKGPDDWPEPELHASGG
jgi:phosphoribosylformimino-5-aminoimidazole carboxamide ribotide isomerase